MELLLTKLTEAGGCGCKIAADSLEKILQYNKGSFIDENLIIGNNHRDDASIYKISEKQAIVSTIDFFTPIVNDPFAFGQIAAANAISDIYAMGGNPCWALVILGFPIDLVDPSIAAKMIEGAVSICEKAKVSIAGGHTINNPQPVFGLTVNGIIDLENIKQNDKAEDGDLIFLTKPLGVGILSTALKLGKIEDAHYNIAVNLMTRLNKIGVELSRFSYVTSMTDVTGFGFLGHLLEICRASKVNAIIKFDKIPIINEVKKYIKQNVVTAGGKRNWESCKNFVDCKNEFNKIILSDPQTNGGLLITIKKRYKKHFQKTLIKYELENFTEPIGEIVLNTNNIITIV